MPPYLNNKGLGDDDDSVGLVGYRLNSDDDHKTIGLPLVGVRVKAQVMDFIAECKLTQCYQNQEAFALQAKYCFPLDESAAVCGFQAVYEDGRIVNGIVKEKDQARKEFSEAVRQGKRANLLETVRRDVFSLDIGNLPAGEHVKITITYVTVLKARDDAAAFILPTYIAPRYTPPSEPFTPAEANALAGTPDARLFGMSIHIDISCFSDIQSIVSPTNAELMCHFEGKSGRVTTTTTTTTMDRDIVVLITEKQSHQPRAVLEKSSVTGGTMAGFVTLFPQIEFPDMKREFCFVIDRSGSMRGNKMQQARDTLLLFLRALPVSCTFNIVSFGSSFSTLFGSAQPYNDETLEIASGHVMKMGADMGGTEIQRPLEHVLSKRLPPNADRQVFVLTDGQVSNDLQVFDTIRCFCSNNARCRLFSVGLGTGVSRHLVEGMARAGRGTSRFVEDGAANALREKVLGQLKQSLQPSLQNVAVKWNFPTKEQDTKPAPPLVKTLLGYCSPQVDSGAIQAKYNPKIYPAVIPPVFNKERFLCFALFPTDCDAMPTSVTVSCQTADGNLETTLEIAKDDVFEGTIAHKLAARAAISEYEDYRKSRSGRHYTTEHSAPTHILSKEEALQLALANGLASEQTSFIAILDDAPLPEQIFPEKEASSPYSTTTSIPQGAHFASSASCSLRCAAVPARQPIFGAPAMGDFVRRRDILSNIEKESERVDDNLARTVALLKQSGRRIFSPFSGFGRSGAVDGGVERSAAAAAPSPSPGVDSMPSFSSMGSRMTKWLNPDTRTTDLGAGMQAHYDAGTKRWCFAKSDEDKQYAKAVPPPPVKAVPPPPAKPVAAEIMMAKAAPVGALMAPPQHSTSPHHHGISLAMDDDVEETTRRVGGGVAPSFAPSNNISLDPPMMMFNHSSACGTKKKKKSKVVSPSAKAQNEPSDTVASSSGGPSSVLPPGWLEATDAPSGDIFYCNDGAESASATQKELSRRGSSQEAKKKMSTKQQQKCGLMDLCLLQKANGSFLLDDSLAKAMGWSNDELMAWAIKMVLVVPSSINYNTLKATVLAVAAMKAFWPHQINVWELQHNKAIQFLESSGLSKHTVETLLKETVSQLQKVSVV